MKDLDEFKAIVPDVFALWEALSSQHYVPAAQIARQFIEKMTGTLFMEGWEFMYQRHGSVWTPNSGVDQLYPKIANAEDDIVERLVRFVMDPQQTRLDFAVEACERFLREMDVDVHASRKAGNERNTGVEGASDTLTESDGVDVKRDLEESSHRQRTVTGTSAQGASTSNHRRQGPACSRSLEGRWRSFQIEWSSAASISAAALDLTRQERCCLP
jgi:hypothetical protein